MDLPAAPSPMPALVTVRRRGTAALAALAALAAVGAAALVQIQPPAARDASAPVGDFSAARAFTHVRAVSTETHVAGSPANDRVREYVLGTLRGLGLTPEVQDTIAARTTGTGELSLGRVRNVVAVLPGTAPTRRVFLVTHYDSVQTGPGGNDDGAGTGALLETARALLAGPRPRNDVVFVLTDAEEAGLLGSAAFVEQHPLARDGGVVLNMEARGSTGPAIMFETSRRNADLVSAYARAPHPVGTSVAVEIYRLLPNDTDFTSFLGAGFTGLNSAYIDGAAVYHTPLDTPEAMDTDSLQHHGGNALALVRDLGDADLGRVRNGGDATYFPVPGGLARYPGLLTWPIAVLGLLAVVALGWSVRRRGRASGWQLAAGTALGVLPIVVAPVLAQLYWTAVTAWRPGYAAPLDPYRPVPFRLAVLALTAFTLFTWYAVLRRRVGPAALAVGALGWPAVLGIVLAALAPGGSYLAALPALASAVAGLLALRLSGRWGIAAVTAGAAVAVLVLLPTTMLLFPALGMAMGGAAALLATLLGLAALPVLELLFARVPTSGGVGARLRSRATLPAVTALAVALVLTAAGLRIERFDAAHPLPTHLMYALDADDGQARWLSEEDPVQQWTGQYVSAAAPVLDTFPALDDHLLRGGPAPAADLPAPRLTVLGDTRAGGVRTIRLRLAPQRPVRLTSLHVAGAARVTSALVNGRAVPADRAEGPWGFGFVFHAPPADGIEVQLSVRDGEPLRIRVMDGSDGLSALPGFRPRPAAVGVAGTHTSELVAVARTYTF